MAYNYYLKRQICFFIAKEWCNKCYVTAGTILKGGLQKVNSNEIIPYIEGNDSYKYAITTANNLNMRKNIDADNDGQKDLIVTLKQYTAIGIGFVDGNINIVYKK